MSAILTRCSIALRESKEIKGQKFFCLASAALAAAFSVFAGTALAQSVEQGEAVFRKCAACHATGEGAVNKVGPVLNGVVGRPAGTYEGYSYSAANKSSGLIWDEDTLRTYLQSPQAKVPGTKMSFAGLQKSSDIESVILYLKQFDASGHKM